MPLDVQSAAREIATASRGPGGGRETTPDGTHPSAEWHENFIGRAMIRAARIHFPLDQCFHDGGTQRLRKWATVLRGLADTLDVLSQNQKLEHQALWFAASAIHQANMKIGGYKHGRNGT